MFILHIIKTFLFLIYKHPVSYFLMLIPRISMTFVVKPGLKELMNTYLNKCLKFKTEYNCVYLRIY